MSEIVLGKTQELEVLREADFGVYLGFPKTGDSVLLPKKQVPSGTKPGDTLTVFIYKDSEDRPIATTKEPYVHVNEFALLEVKAVSRIGAFLDWGLEKDLFLPYKEMEGNPEKGDRVFVYVYVDKSGRLSSTMRVYDYLSSVTDDEFKTEEAVTGYVYRTAPSVGVFVAVKEPGTSDHCIERAYYGLVPSAMVYERYRTGQTFRGHVQRVRPDGKIDLRGRGRTFEMLNTDGEVILDKINEFGGVLPFSESASPELIKRELHMSKAAFKRALGHLLKAGKIEINEDHVKLL